MYSQPINLNTDDEYLMGKEKEPEKEDEELKKVRASPVCITHAVYARLDVCHMRQLNCCSSTQFSK